MNKFILFFLLFLMINLQGQSQKENSFVMKGKVVYSGKNHKYFAILLQDTSLIGNKFEMPIDFSLNIDLDSVKYYPTVIIDSILFIKCERYLKKKSNNVSFHTDMHTRKWRKFIRLYISYINKLNELEVIVQFIKLKEYRDYESIYANQLVLLSPRFRYAVIKFKKGEY